MKKLTLIILIVFSFTTLLNAKSADYMKKIITLHNIISSGSMEYNATKDKDGYKLYIKSNDPLFNKYLSSKPINIDVDEGPIVIKPKFTLATAGLSAKGSILDIFKPTLVKNLEKSLKSKAKYSYEGLVTFGGELEEQLRIDPIELEGKDFTLESSKLISSSKFDLDTITGENSIKVDNLHYTQKDTPLIDTNLKAISTKVIVTQEPIDNIMLFSKFNFSVDRVHLNIKDRQLNQDLNFKIVLNGETKRIDSKLLNLAFGYKIEALDEKTIASFKGIKSSSFELNLNNLGIDGFLKLIKLQKEYQKLNNSILKASNNSNDVAMQKAILKTQELANNFVPIWNKLILKDKTKLKLNLELNGQKRSFIKLDLLYKGKPLSGDVNSAFISLAAQELNLFNGDIEILLDSTIASTINPFAIIGLEMAKSKGFITMENGLYHLKAKLENGKIIINGKSYTIVELGKAMF